jgi:hypothetical protein
MYLDEFKTKDTLLLLTRKAAALVAFLPLRLPSRSLDHLKKAKITQ